MAKVADEMSSLLRFCGGNSGPSRTISCANVHTVLRSLWYGAAHGCGGRALTPLCLCALCGEGWISCNAMLVAVLRSGAGVAGEQLDGTVFCLQSRGDLAQLSYLQRDGRECWKHFRGTSFFSESAGPVVVLCEACAGRRALGGDRKEPCVFRLLFLARMLSGHVGPPLFFSFTSVFLTCFRPFSLLFPSLERSLSSCLFCFVCGPLCPLTSFQRREVREELPTVVAAEVKRYHGLVVERNICKELKGKNKTKQKINFF